MVRRQRGKKDAVRSFDTEEKARAVADELRKLVAGKTVMQAIDAWCADIQRQEKSPELEILTRYCLNRMTAVKSTGDVPLSSITPRRAAAMYDVLVRDGLSPATHRQALKRAKSWFRWLIDQGFASENPFEDVKPVGRVPRGKKQLRVTTSRSFVDYCLGAAEQDLAAVAALCGILLGLRPGETVELRGLDVDDNGRLLWIGDGKTDAARRQLEVPDILASHLVRLKETSGDTGRLFPRKASWVTKALHRLCRGAGVERITAHGLRGTHGTLAMRGGTSSHLALAALGEVSRSLGHASTTITTQHYVRREATEDVATSAVLRVITGGRG